MDGEGGAGCIGNDGDILSFPKILHIKNGCTRTKQASYWACEDKTAIFLFFCMGKSVQGQKNIAIYISSPPRVQGGGRVKWGGSPLSFLPGKSLSFPLCVCVCERERERTGGCIFFPWEKRVSGERYLNPSSFAPAPAWSTREREKGRKKLLPRSEGEMRICRLQKCFSRRIRPTLDRVARWTRDEYAF